MQIIMSMKKSRRRAGSNDGLTEKDILQGKHLSTELAGLSRSNSCIDMFFVPQFLMKSSLLLQWIIIRSG